MDCSGFEDSQLSKASLRLHAGAFLEPNSQILLDVVCGDINQAPRTEHSSEMLHCPLICLMGLLSTDRRLRVVLHKGIRTILKSELFAPAYDLQRTRST
jgi:hypothetical protein